MKRFSGLMAMFIFWEILSFALKSPMFPRFTEVLTLFYNSDFRVKLFSAIYVSLFHVLTGFFVAYFLAVLFGVLMHLFLYVSVVFVPVVDSIRSVAALTLYPLIIILLGIGWEAKVFIIFWTSWPAILLTTVQGLGQVDQEIVEAASLDGASKYKILKYISFPLAFPIILTGARIGMSGGWISLVSAEMLGGNNGLGFLILYYSQTFNFPEMYGTIIIIALLGFLLNTLLLKLQKIYTERLYNEKGCTF